MLHRVDFSQSQYRWLYQPLYERIEKFAATQGWPESEVVQRFIRLVARDNTLHYLIEFEEGKYSIKSHALIHIAQISEGALCAFIEQVEADNNAKNTFVYDVEEYINIDLLALFPALSCIKMTTNRKDYRAFTKKYGMNVERVVMTKPLKTLVASDGEVH